MTDKVYNIYLRMARLACDNIKYQIGRVNHISERSALSNVSVKVKNRDHLVGCVENIIQNPDKAVAYFSDQVNSLLVIKTDYAYKISAGVIFVESVLNSRNSRIYQKQLVDIQMCEIYLQEAYDYDKAYPYRKKEESAVETAKNVIISKYGRDMLNKFSLTGKPQIKPDVKTSIINAAFDKYYAFPDATPVTNLKLAQKKYLTEFADRNDFFLNNKPTRQGFAQYNAIREASNMLKQPVTADENKDKPDTTIIMELYQGAFANIPLKHRIRKFVNLKVRNRDILICPPRNLAVKRQYATIEALTKHHYIMQFYDDGKPKGLRADEIDGYYYSKELEIYQRMWGTEEVVYIQNNRMYFPNGTNIPIPEGSKPQEFFHKVNCTYGSLFGFTPDDIEGGRNWLNDSVRSAYTDEGMAEYRLAMIEARLKGRI